MSEQTLIDCYKLCRLMSESDAIGETAVDCEACCTHLLRVMHEVGGYVECVAWDASRETLNGATP